MLKTHECAQLNKTYVGNRVTLAGWVDRRRDHGGLIFIDLRDRSGIVQVVFNPEISKPAHEVAYDMRNEYCIQVEGEVERRPAGTENPKLATGEIEVIAEKTVVLNTSKTPPFYVNEDVEVDESLRLRYRYLDLRRERMKKNLFLRDDMVIFFRNFLHAKGFIEVETPILLKSTPEGSREHLVPSRQHPGEFYALAQSPQQLKQLLMVAGYEKYFQIARCFRDEDTRADRQPEFTQLDIEMSFIDEHDLLDLMEEMLTGMAEKIKPGIRMLKPFPRLKFADAMERYGSDKPDLRFGMEMADLSDVVGKSEFSVFRNAVEGGGKVKGICAPGCGNYTRTQLEDLNRFVQSLGAKGLLTVSLGTQPGPLDNLTMDVVRSVAAKYVTLDQVKEMARRLGAKTGDLLLIVADKNAATVNNVLGELRKEMGRRLKLAAPDLLAFAFIVDFPLFEWVEQEKRFQPMHHPFTSPRIDEISLLDTAPEKVHGRHYDVVLNGYEIGGGSIRVHNGDLQRKVFRILGHHDEKMASLFGHLLEALDYGAPPHGGIAFGFDRLVMILAGENTIREVIAFPKNQSAVDLMLNAPSSVSEQQLAELHLCLRKELNTGGV